MHPKRRAGVNSVIPQAQITGRCYCGKTTLQSNQPPLAVTYCHCSDCRRVTGAPVAAFASFEEEAITFNPGKGKEVRVNDGVIRSFCDHCGTPISGCYDYLPGVVYIAIGILDQADKYAPEVHAHNGNRLEWLNIVDGCPKFEGSARTLLNDADRRNKR